jgi:hypothetical protein
MDDKNAARFRRDHCLNLAGTDIQIVRADRVTKNRCAADVSDSICRRNKCQCRTNHLVARLDPCRLHCQMKRCGAVIDRNRMLDTASPGKLSFQLGGDFSHCNPLINNGFLYSLQLCLAKIRLKQRYTPIHCPAPVVPKTSMEKPLDREYCLLPLRPPKAGNGRGAARNRWMRARNLRGGQCQAIGHQTGKS